MGQGQNPLAGGAPAAVADPFAGRFRGQEIALELAPETGGIGAAGRLAGTLTFRGQAYPARAAHTGADVLEGTFEAGGAPYPFMAVLRGATVALSSGGQTYILEREGAAPAPPPNPLAGGPGGPAPAPAPAPGPAQAPPPPPPAGGAALTQTYKHAVGFTLRYPAGWTAQETAMGLVLTPGDAARNASGPTEVYVVMGNPTQATRPDDPQIGQFMDMWVAQNIPGFRRDGAPAAARSGDRAGAVYSWSGRVPQTGADGRVRSYCTIMNGYAVGVLCLGEKAPVDARDATIRAIFDSFGMSAAQLDPVLVGTWYKRNYTNIERTPGVDGTGLNAVSVVQMTLAPDGTCQRGGTYAFSNPRGTGDAASGPVRGRWGAANGTVTIVMDDGTTFAMTYYVQGTPGNRDLLLTPVGGGKKDQQLWGENPNRD